MPSDTLLVIGSNSFSGSHFVAGALQEGHRVLGVSRSEEADEVFLPYRWPQAETDQPLANEDNFLYRSVDLNRNLDELLGLIDRERPAYICLLYTSDAADE